MKTLTISLVFLCHLSVKAMGQDLVIIKFYTDSGDSIDVNLSGIISIDTTKNLLELTPALAEKLKPLFFKIGKIALNEGKKNWSNVYLIDAMSSHYYGETEMLTLNNMLYFQNNAITIYGNTWKRIAKIYNLSQ